jgi:2-(1,2-epoxy-1,2-dihydrophenyl)acetyl-CoA isomerase
VPDTYEDLIAAGALESRQLIDIQRRDERAVITLDDPAKLNVLSAGLVLQLQRALGELTDDPGMRTIVLTGADPAFSTGGDLRMMQAGVETLAGDGGQGATLMWRWIRRQFGGITRLIVGADQTVIAAVNAAAAGVGLVFALAADLILASERAILVPAFGRLGLIPEVGTSWLLTRRIGYQRAFEFFTSGAHVDARTALSWGLVNEVVAHEQLLARADAWCDRLAALPTYAPQMAKALLRQAASMSWEQSLATEEFAEPACFTTAPFSAAVERSRTSDRRAVPAVAATAAGIPD